MHSHSRLTHAPTGGGASPRGGTELVGLKGAWLRYANEVGVALAAPRRCWLWQAWAEYKGRVRPGDPPDPAGWKTRLRCALARSPEFREVPARNRLDGPSPYRVYRLLPARGERQTGRGRQGGTGMWRGRGEWGREHIQGTHSNWGEGTEFWGHHGGRGLDEGAEGEPPNREGSGWGRVLGLGVPEDGGAKQRRHQRGRGEGSGRGVRPQINLSAPSRQSRSPPRPGRTRRTRG